MEMNSERVKQGVFSFLIVVWGMFIFKKAYDPAEFYYLFVGAQKLILAGSVIAHFRIAATYLWNFINLFILVGSSFVIGGVILSAWRMKFSSFLEKFLVGLGLGLAFWSYLTFFLGILGLLNVALFKWLFWTVFVLSVWFLVKNKEEFALQFATFRWPRSYLAVFSMSLLVIALLINVVCALAPEIHYDVLVYHLALPDFYKMHGRILDVPFNFCSYFPQNMNMLYLLTLMVSNDNVAKLLHLFLGISSILVIYVFARKHFSRKVAIAAAAGFYLVPQVALESWTAQNDLGITFYVLLNVWCLDNWLAEKAFSKKYLYLAAVFSGFALGIKYVSAATVVISLSFILYHYGYCQRHWKKSFFEIGKFVAIVFLMVSPWLLRNISFTGSPFAPFAVDAQKSVLGSDFRKDVFFADCNKPQSFSVKDFLLTPWLNTLGKDSSDTLAGPLFIFFVPFLMMMLIRTKTERKLLRLVFYFFMYFILWRSQTSGWRYLLPALAAFCIIIACLLYDERINRINGGLLKIVFAGILLGNLAVICMALERVDPVRVLLGQETKEAYLGHSHLFYQFPAYPVIEYINKNVSPGSRILFVGDSRGYYCERDYIANSAFDVPTFQKYFKTAKDADELAQNLRREGITHILYNEGEFVRLQNQYRIFDFQPRDLKLLQEFWRKHSKSIFFMKGVGLYQIL